jgi:uncharacterized DUF497 family protein
VDDLQFEWDATNARQNARKHGVPFSEAAPAFRDPLARVMAEQVTGGEPRLVMAGVSSLGRLLEVVFVDRGRIRIISTRRATPFERHAYEEARG